jgi:hypothetical protein
MILLAHHLEAHHVPILASFFAAGFFIGWQALSRWLARGRAAAPKAGDTAPDPVSRG